MCQTNLISQNIERLSVRSYRQRLKVSTPDSYNLSYLVHLNKDLEDFYELLYSQWNTITEDDYHVFGGKLQIMLQTIKELLDTFITTFSTIKWKDEINILKMNYSALFELNSDIINFRIKLPKDSDIKALMDEASSISKALNL